MLNHYGFGGILADDMGLGKTLQTIAFLSSVADVYKRQHLDLGFAHFLESLDRLIAMNLLEVYETEEGLQFRFVPPLEADQFFANVAYQKLLEKKIGEIGRASCRERVSSPV